MQERSLHAALKRWYARPRDRLEEIVEGFHIDIVRGKLLIEIQTANFSAVKRKLGRLVEKHRVRLVYPIAREKWIVRVAADGLTELGRRKSPKHGDALDLFRELVSIPELLAERNFSLEVLFTREEEIRRDDGRGSRRRRGWSIFDRRLLDVVDRLLIRRPADLRAFLPRDLPEQFTSSDLSDAAGCRLDLAQKITYCLRKMGAIAVIGKRRNAFLYAR